jgi:hypothetical protein
VNDKAKSYRFEREMVNPIISHLPLMFEPLKGQRTLLLREQAVGSVIPDLMFGIWSGDLPRCSGLNLVSRQILAWLAARKKADSAEHLSEYLFISERATHAAVSTLQRVGAISKRTSGELEIQPEFDFSETIYLVAIEMKLKRWREALLQAIQYRSFANEAYVALDAGQVRVTADVRAMFVSSGVGLFLQNAESVEKIIEARSRTPEPSVERLFAVGKFATSGFYCLA